MSKQCDLTSGCQCLIAQYIHTGRHIIFMTMGHKYPDTGDRNSFLAGQSACPVTIAGDDLHRHTGNLLDHRVPTFRIAHVKHTVKRRFQPNDFL